MVKRYERLSANSNGAILNRQLNLLVLRCRLCFLAKRGDLAAPVGKVDCTFAESILRIQNKMSTVFAVLCL
jgi:hypothetical protein